MSCECSFPQYADDFLPGFADKRFRAAISHDICELLHGFGGVVPKMLSEKAFVGDADSATGEVFERGKRCRGAWIHRTEV